MELVEIVINGADVNQRLSYYNGGTILHAFCTEVRIMQIDFDLIYKLIDVVLFFLKKIRRWI